MLQEFEPKKEKILRGIFDIGIGLKGCKGLVEVGLGICLLLISSTTLTAFFARVIASDFVQDTTISVHLIASLAHFSNATKNFAAWYIIFHGSLSLFIVVSLYLKKLWAYVVMLIVTSGFIMYQLYELLVNHVYILGLVIIFDIIIFILTWHEYQQNKL